jgi:hypothetical protein
VHRLELPALTREAVATLARPEGIDPDRLHRATGGNPFFVTELLGAPIDTSVDKPGESGRLSTSAHRA